MWLMFSNMRTTWRLKIHTSISPRPLTGVDPQPQGAEHPEWGRHVFTEGVHPSAQILVPPWQDPQLRGVGVRGGGASRGTPLLSTVSSVIPQVIWWDIVSPPTLRCVMCHTTSHMGRPNKNASVFCVTNWKYYIGKVWFLFSPCVVAW